MKEKAVFGICLGVSLALLVAGFCVPPPAVIDGSVLTACGILFAFAALGKVDKLLEKGYDAKITHGDTSVEVTNGETEVKDEEEVL